MYLDQNILRILFGISEETDITEQIDSYLSSCFLAASEALVIFKNKNSVIDTEFNELIVDFETSIQTENPDSEVILNLLDKLRENTEFERIYKIYIDSINKKIITLALEKNPEVAEEIQEYTKQLNDTLLTEYIETFIKPEVNE